MYLTVSTYQSYIRKIQVIKFLFWYNINCNEFPRLSWDCIQFSPYIRKEIQEKMFYLWQYVNISNINKILPKKKHFVNIRFHSSNATCSTLVDLLFLQTTHLYKITLLSHTADIVDNAFPKSNYLPIIRIKKMSVIRPSGWNTNVLESLSLE